MACLISGAEQCNLQECRTQGDCELKPRSCVLGHVL